MDRDAVRIEPAAFPRDLADVRAFFREYADSLGVDLSFQDFERELTDLPGEYVPPRRPAERPVPERSVRPGSVAGSHNAGRSVRLRRCPATP